MLAGRPRGLAGQPKLAGRVGKSHTARAPSVFARSPAAQHLWTGQIRPNWIRARGGGRAGRGGEALAKPAELANANARLPCHCCVALSARLSSPLLCFLAAGQRECSQGKLYDTEPTGRLPSS